MGKKVTVGGRRANWCSVPSTHGGFDDPLDASVASYSLHPIAGCFHAAAEFACCMLLCKFVKGFFGRLGVMSQDMAVTEEGVQGHQQQRQRPASISCIPKVDALWFCYSPVYQMTEYYREGTFDNCRHKWTELFGCISLKTKPQSQIQEILQERERAQQHIWEFRTPEEAGKHWKEEFGHLQD